MSFVDPITALAGVAGLAGAGLGAAGTIAGGEAQAKTAAYQAAIAQNNAIAAGQKAAYADAAGESNAQTQALKNRSQVGQIKAGQAGNGIDVNTGSAADVRISQEQEGDLSTANVLNNAGLQAYGYRTAATSDVAQASLDEATAAEAPKAADLAAAGGLLGQASGLGLKWAGFGSSFSSGSGSNSGLGWNNNWDVNQAGA